MNEVTKFGVCKKKLQGICNENELVFSFNKDRYPITMTVKPTGGISGQMSMLEDAENGYISPDATLVFAYGEEGITWQTTETFTVSETLFNKLKKYFKDMCTCWLQYFFRDLMEHSNIPKENLPQEQEMGDDCDLDDDPLDSESDDLDAGPGGDEDGLDET